MPNRNLRFARSFGAIAIHVRVAFVVLVISSALLIYGLTLKEGTEGDAYWLFGLVLFGLVYLAVSALAFFLVRAQFNHDSIEFRNLLCKGEVALGDIEDIWLMNRWWTSWAGGSLTWLEASSPCVAFRTSDGRRVKLIATAPVNEESDRMADLCSWGREHGFDEIRVQTRLSVWMDRQSDFWRRRRK